MDAPFYFPHFSSEIDVRLQMPLKFFKSFLKKGHLSNVSTLVGLLRRKGRNTSLGTVNKRMSSDDNYSSAFSLEVISS